jgi:hypothetical protein
VRRLGVGDVAFDLLGSRFGEESNRDEKMGDVIHGVHPYPESAIVAGGKGTVPSAY